MTKQELEQFQTLEEELQAAISSTEQEIEQHQVEIAQLRTQLNDERLDLAKYEERVENLQAARSRLGEEQNQRDTHREEAERRYQSVSKKKADIALQLLNTSAALAEQRFYEEKLSVNLAVHQKQRNEIRETRAHLSAEELKCRHALRQLEEKNHEKEMRERDIKYKITHLEERLQEEFGMSLSQAADQGHSAIRMFLDAREAEQALEEQEQLETEEPQDQATEEEASAEPIQHSFAEDPPRVDFSDEPEELITEIRQAIEDRIAALRRKLKSIGNVNTESLQELEELETRYTRLNGQLQDLTEAKSSLEEIVRKINLESRRLFTETFEQIRGHFQEIFRKLFGGGNGDIILEDAEDVLECGIDVVARPPGKRTA